MRIFFVVYYRSMSNGLHHVHKRKRAVQKKKVAPFPHHSGMKKILDRAVYVIGIAAPLMTLPQVYKIYSTKDAVAISLITFSANVFFNLFWLTYGYVHKEWPLVFMYTGWLCVNTSIVIGAILYG